MEENLQQKFQTEEEKHPKNEQGTFPDPRENPEDDPFTILEYSNFFSSMNYWNERYKKLDISVQTEWFFNFDLFKKQEILKTKILNKLQFDSSILEIGCGNSSFSAQMHESGYTNIVAIDFAPSVISSMKQKYSNYKGLQFLIMDAKEMSFPNEAFELVIDKGTLDAIVFGTEDGSEKYISEVDRVLKKNGTAVIISARGPKLRFPYFTKLKFNWKIQYTRVLNAQYNMFHVYILIKSADESFDKEESWKELDKYISESDDSE